MVDEQCLLAMSLEELMHEVSEVIFQYGELRAKTRL